MRSLLKLYLVFLAIIVMIVNYGCKKTDIAETDTRYSTVKIYDDTLASFLNSSINIASGSDRIFMTYGIGNSNIVSIIGSGVYYLTFGDFAKLIAVDNTGALIWKNSLPTEMIVNDILAMDDGGCLVTCLKADTITWISSYIYLYRYDANGHNTLSDSINLSIPGGVTQYNSVNILRALNGNMIFYGIYQPVTGPTSVYAGEYNLNLQPIWAKQYSSFQYSSTGFACVKTNDGGYLLACDNNLESGLPGGRIVIRKTNSTGDTLWTKYFNGHPAALCNDLAASNNGNYFLSFYSESDSKKQTFIYEINSAGDSLNAATINRSDQLYNNGLMATDDGGVFALMNLMQGQTNYYNQDFENASSSLIFDASLNLKNNQVLNPQTNAYFNHVCNTSDGKLAVAGLIQMAGQIYYKPSLLIYK